MTTVPPAFDLYLAAIRRHLLDAQALDCVRSPRTAAICFARGFPARWLARRLNERWLRGFKMLKGESPQ